MPEQINLKKLSDFDNKSLLIVDDDNPFRDRLARAMEKKGFTVLPYINADPMLALHLEDIGCATVMPLGSPIGSGQGLNNLANIKIIIENSNIPVIVDAGIGAPSQAALAMELGADGVLLNTAVAQSKFQTRVPQPFRRHHRL